MIVVDNAFGPGFLAEFDGLTEESFQEVVLDGEAKMWAQEATPYEEDLLHRTVEQQVGRPLKMLQTFLRYNFPEDTQKFRMHSDGIVLGEQPDVACVYYIKPGGSGTATYKHPVYGAEGQGTFNEDDGLWEMVDKCEGKPDRLLIYPARAYHQRHPFKVAEERIVIVGFYKYD
jgi:hypothetical protein